MATGGGDFMSDELIINKCCVCAKKNKRTEADKYCVDCTNYYCSLCADVHTVVPHMEEHKLLDKTAFKSFRSDGALPSFPTQRCSLHPSKVVDMFCQEHDEVACASCIALNHRVCTRVFSVPEHTEYLYIGSGVSSVKKNIIQTQKSLKEIKKATEAKIKELKVSFNTTVTSVKTFTQELIALLDKTEKETITEMKKRVDEIETSLTKEMKDIETLITALNNAASQLENTEEIKSREFVGIKMSRQLILLGKQKINQLQSETDTTVSFSADPSVKSFLQQLKMFGEVEYRKPIDSKPRLAVEPLEITEPVTFLETNLFKVTEQSEVDVRVPGDETSAEIGGTCITEDGCLLLTDYNNYMLKRLNLALEKVTDYLSFESGLNAICMISKNRCAVSLTCNTVQFVSLGEKMKVTRTLTFNHACKGIAYNSGKLYISDYENSVYICDINGKELRRITTDESGKNIFQKTRHIAVDADGGRVFVADLEKGLITLDLQGNYLWSLSSKEMQSLHCLGVCTDGSNVFVCSFNLGNIVQIRLDHKLFGTIQKVSKPRALSFDARNSRLVVAKQKVPFGKVITVMKLM